MLFFKKILWPTDFSGPSYKALNVAKELSLNFSSELYVVHVITPLPPIVEVPPGKPRFNISSYLDQLKSSAEKSLKEVIDKKLGKGLKVHAIVAYGDPAVEIARIAKRKNVELIVIGTHGTTNEQSFFLGSISEKILRIASCFVLSIRSSPKEK